MKKKKRARKRERGATPLTVFLWWCAEDGCRELPAEAQLLVCESVQQQPQRAVRSEGGSVVQVQSGVAAQGNQLTCTWWGGGYLFIHYLFTTRKAAQEEKAKRAT